MAVPTGPDAAQQLREASAVFGDLRLAGSRREVDGEITRIRAAGNLLEKALRRLRDGDEAAATRLVARATDLRAERSDEFDAGPFAARAVLDDALRALRQRDPSWLDTALPVLGRVGGPAATELARALLESDDLAPAERRRIREATGEVPFGDPLRDAVDADRVPLVLAVLRTALLLEG